MTKYRIVEDRKKYWQVAKVYKDNIEICTINCFYEVTPDWILIYNAKGGSGYGYTKGELIQKIYIGDGEFYHEFI